MEIGTIEGEPVEAPSVAIVCTVPYIDTSSTEIPEAYATSRYETGTSVVGKSVLWAAGGEAFTRLFESGDRRTPRPRYDDVQDLTSSLVCDGFRGAAWITEVRIYHDDHRPIGASYRWGARVGYTPIRTQLLLPYLPLGRNLTCLSGALRVGPNSNRPDLVEETNSGYTATLSIEFKLSRAVDVAQWLFTRHLAPFAWLQIDYGLDWSPDTAGQALFVPTGSFLPSLHPYVDWQCDPHWVYDMQGTAQEDVHDFVEAGQCQSAPAREADLSLPKAF